MTDNNWPPYDPKKPGSGPQGWNQQNPQQPYNQQQGSFAQNPQQPYNQQQGSFAQNPQQPYNQQQGSFAQNPQQPYYQQPQGSFAQNPQQPYYQQDPYNQNPQQPYYQQDPYAQSQYGYAQPYTQAGIVTTTEGVFFQRIYTWMCIAVAVSALTGYLLVQSDSWLEFLFYNKYAWIGIVIVQFGIVLAIGYLCEKVSAAAVKFLFLLFAVSIGATISVVLIVYPTPIINRAFFCAAGVYGAMALYGVMTKKSLQAWGTFLYMGLCGLLIAMIVNLIFGGRMLDFIICVVGVVIFAGLTAYDHQKLRVIYAGGFQDAEEESKAITLGALELYLDFVNIFLFLVRLFGADD